MRNWFVWFAVLALLLAIGGCSTEVNEMPPGNKITYPTTEVSEPPPTIYDGIEYWEIIQDEIVSMLRKHNLYLTATTHGYPCKQFHVAPCIMADDGQVVVSGLSQEEYEKIFESVKVELHIILDRYKLAKPKTVFHGCYSMLDIFFQNWIVDENKIYDNVYSREVACYGLDLLKYYHDDKENSCITRDAIFVDIWTKYPTYTPGLCD